MIAEFWAGKRVLLTGHTGFKGGWAVFLLDRLGARVTGLALAPDTSPSFFDLCDVRGRMEASLIGDIRDPAVVRNAVQHAQPDIVIHMAAQALVRRSYAEPAETYATNVMGTVNLLEAVRTSGTSPAVVNVTSDKCYENPETDHAFTESDPMGGYDPYSSSKACAELVTTAYRRSFGAQMGLGIASARAGNVIGGGDFSADRLVPDAVNAFRNDQPLTLRNPDATRPWQHVLEPLGGYLRLAELLAEDPERFGAGWNFGPNPSDSRSVLWVTETFNRLIGATRPVSVQSSGLHEASHLRLDSSRARDLLGWRPRWNAETALSKTADWYTCFLAGGDVAAITDQQIDAYLGEP